MNSSGLIERLQKIPGAKQVKNHLLKQGHTEQEATAGALAMAGLVIFLMVLLFNSFLFAIIKAFFANIWDYFAKNPTDATGIGIFGTVIFLGILFQFMNRATAKKKELHDQERMKHHRIGEKQQYIKKGAMGNYEEVFRYRLAEKYPEIEIKSVHVINTTPRIRFQAKRFNTELGGDVNTNYKLFREALFADILHIMETVFGMSENIPALIVDAMMNFISRSAKYYDGVVLSVRAQRNVFERLDLKKGNPFKLLSTFELHYNDGMEVQPIPGEEDKTAAVLEKIKEKAPKVDVFYPSLKKEKVDDGWEKPVDPGEPMPIQETFRGKELSSMPLPQFQELVAGLLGKYGFDVQKVKKLPGGIIQVLADFAHPIIGGAFLILARQQSESAPIHAEMIRELDELTREEACKRGIYIVTCPFTEEAKNNSKKMAVDLVDGKRLLELIEGPAFDGRWTFRIVDEKGVVTDLSRMPLLNFEQEEDLFLKSMGFKVEKIRRVPGGSVVAVAEYPHPITGGKFAVMGKQFPPETRVPPELVSELSHIMKAEFCHRGLLMVPCDYSMEARALARFSNVELVDRNLWDNLRRHR
jgi:hypothetical protein